MEQWSWWNPTSQHYQPCEGMTEEEIALPTLLDHTAIVGTREEDKAVYPTLETLFKKKRNTAIEQITCFNLYQ